MINIQKVPEIIRILGKMIETVQAKLSIPMLKPYMNRLVLLYNASDSPERSDLILVLLEKEIPELAERKKKNLTKKEIVQIIDRRPPITRLYDLKEIAKGEGMTEEAVEQGLTSQVDEKDAYFFKFSEKSKNYLVEFEKDRLIGYFTENKIKLDRIAQTFKESLLQNKAIIPNLLRAMIKDHLIRGFISKEYFYPMEYLKKELQTVLQKEGKIILSTYNSLLSPEFVSQLFNELIGAGIFVGFYDKNKTTFFTLKKIIGELEQQAAKSNIIDLAPYANQFEYDDFLRIEEHGRTHLFTPFHKKHVWLSNLGLTRIQTYLRTCEQIGEYDPKLAAKKLDMPLEIVKDATKDYFPHINGFWNTDFSKFYYAKFVRDQITKIQSEPDAAKRIAMIEKLSKDLNIDKGEIEKKVDEKLKIIADKLASADEFELQPLLRQFQMDQVEFITFVEGLERPYFISGGKIIFNQDRINKEKTQLQENLEKDTTKADIFDLNRAAQSARVSKQIIIELFKASVTAEKVKGIWISEDKFLTERGIINKILNLKNYIALNTLVEKANLDETEIALLEKILKELIETNRLVGKYDEESKIFQSETAIQDANLDAERARFSEEIGKYITEMEFTYNAVRDILMVDDITPGQMSEYEKLLEETIRHVISGETFVKRIISNVDAVIRKRIMKATPPKSKYQKKDARKDKDQDDEFEGPSFKDDEVVAGLLNDFERWKTILFAIEQKAGQLVFLKKKIKSNPEDEDSQKKYKGLLEYLGFLD
jgi:hypothetical protein